MANEVTGQQMLVEDGIKIQVKSQDGRINLSSNGTGVSRQILGIDRQAVSAMSAVSPGAVSICFEAQLPDDLEVPEVKKTIAVDRGWGPVFQPTVLQTARVVIAQVPMFPFDMTTEALDIAVYAEDGSILVASTQPDGTFTGDVDTTATSAYNPTTGAVDVTFNKILQFEQLVTVRKRFPVTGATPLEVDVPDLLPFTIDRDCNFILKPKINQPYLAGLPISPNTVAFNAVDTKGKRLTITDDGAGKLIGDIDVSGTNTVDYTTGEVKMTLVRSIHGPVLGGWGVVKEVIEHPGNTVNPDEKTMIRVDIDWEDIHRIVLSMSQAAVATEQNIKYRS